MFKRAGSSKSLGKNDWVFICTENEEVEVQSIFLKPLARKSSTMKLVRRPDGLETIPLTFRPRRESVDLLMDWAIQDLRLHSITITQAKELLWIAEELGMTGLVHACDVWLESQARNGKLFGTSIQMQEQSDRAELTRDFWDRFANIHNLRRLSACCEASIEGSPQTYKRQHRDLTRRLSDVSWSSNPSDRRVSIDA